MVGVHLPSLMAYSGQDQTLMTCRVAEEIRIHTEKYSNLPLIIIGDFNMNPFHDALVGSEGFHALMDRRDVTKKTRIIQGTERRILYNPIWGALGDISDGPPGTYYYRDSKPISHFWHAYDQVLISAELLDFFDDQFQIVENIGGVGLQQ